MTDNDERLTAVLLQHGNGLRVSTREHWIECLCGERLPCQLDSDGYAVEDDGDDRAYAAHTVLSADEFVKGTITTQGGQGWNSPASTFSHAVTEVGKG